MKKYFTVMLLCVVLSIFIILLSYDQNKNIVNYKTDNNQTIRVEAPMSTPEIEYSMYEFAIPYDYIENLNNTNNQAYEEELESIRIKSFFAVDALVDPIDTAIENEIAEYIEPVKTIEYKEGYIYYDIDFEPELQEYVQDICKEYNIDHKLVLALIGCESEYKADAISKTSDYGLMQINKCNFKHIKEEFGDIDFLNAKDNILAGIYMLSLVKDYAKNNNELLMCYNLGVNGAKTKWKKGIYSNTYTEKVQERIESLKGIE